MQCAGPSIFGQGSGGAVAILSNGTWHQLAWVSGSWQPLQGENDAGTWQLLVAPSAVNTARVVLVRFVATPPTSAAATTPGTAPAQEWTAVVTLALGPPEHARFVEGTIVANYGRIVPSGAGAPTSGG
jgi:hypothetical protein